MLGIHMYEPIFYNFCKVKVLLASTFFQPVCESDWLTTGTPSPVSRVKDRIFDLRTVWGFSIKGPKYSVEHCTHRQAAYWDNVLGVCVPIRIPSEMDD